MACYTSLRYNRRVLPSPYAPGGVPTVLAGREPQLAEIRHELGAVAAFGQLMGRIRVETGPRGMGKTSLLNAVRNTADEAGFVTAWATARDDEPLIKQITHALSRGLDQIGLTTTHAGRLRDRIRSLELGIGPAKAGVQINADRAGSTPPAASALRELITTASAGARERGSAGLCLLVDEIQAAPAGELRTLAYAWQEMQLERVPPAAALFAAGLSNAPDVLTAAVTFSERFAFRPLHRLGATDTADALARPAAALDVTWTPALLDLVVDATQGYPYFVQLFGHAVWRVASPEPGHTLTTAHMAAAQAIVDADTAAMFRARWAKATPGEQRFLAAMAAADGDTVRRADLARRLRVETSDLSTQRRRLIDKGLIEPAGHGLLQFTTPGFAAFVLDETSHR